jgi:nitrogenase molybdenum-iron protein NifN
MKLNQRQEEPYSATTNACKLCKPLGACLAFRGIEGAIPFLHGSQGCATYMRRYIISHYREPMDIASSSLGEKHAVYGGGPNLKLGLNNVMNKYDASMVGIATTCLTETIGDDVPMIIREFVNDLGNGRRDTDIPPLVTVSTPSYSGTHTEGFHAAVRAVLDRLSSQVDPHEGLNIFPGFVSPADVRYLKEVLEDFHLKGTVLPDISRTLDGVALTQYENVPSGGTPISQILSMGGSRASLEFSRTLDKQTSPAALLEERFGVRRHTLGMPIGLRESDELFDILSEASGREIPEEHSLERGRLIDAYVDGHKYVFGKRAVVYGEADLVVGLTAFLSEIGIQPVLCATGSESGKLEDAIRTVAGELLAELPAIMEGVDFFRIEESAAGLMPDLLIGNSKGHHLARKLGVPLVRVGFPIHDRFGGQRLLHVGYRGTQSLFDRVVNTLIASKQYGSPVGYTYM